MTITKHSTLQDVCFAVAAALEADDIGAVLTGGSAATMYAPEVYTSLDADFVLEPERPLAEVAKALASIGFARNGKSGIFLHKHTKYTVDFPKGPLAVGGDYVHETATLRFGKATLRILSRTDCIRDRLAHFYYWEDYTALRAAVGVALADSSDIDMDVLRTWSMREGHSKKFAEFERRLASRH